MASLREQVAAIPYWFHRIELNDGTTTPGVDDSQEKLRRIGLPADLEGLSVLDVGTFNGFFAFEAERRGASRVVAIDPECWDVPGLHARAGFDLCHRALRSRIEPQRLSVYDLEPAIARFEVVLFLGVPYHLRHPLLALERLATVSSDLLIVETHVDAGECSRPAMIFYPGAELNSDPTNWWGPNPAAVAAMLRSAGFGHVQMMNLHGNRADFHARSIGHS